MVADALPDDFGNALIDAWMAERGVAKSEITALDRLAYMGKRGLGRWSSDLRAEHTARAPCTGDAIAGGRGAAAGFGQLSWDREAQAALANIIRVGTSAGGARAKA